MGVIGVLLLQLVRHASLSQRYPSTMLQELIKTLFRQVQTNFCLCNPFTWNWANSVTNCSTISCSKTCTVLQVLCKQNVDLCRFLSIQKLDRTYVNGVLYSWILGHWVRKATTQCKSLNLQALVFQKMDKINAIHRIDHYPVDKTVLAKPIALSSG